MRDEEIIKAWKESQMCSEIESHFAEESHNDFQKEFVELVKKCTVKLVFCTDCVYTQGIDCKKPKRTDCNLSSVTSIACYYGKEKAWVI